MKRKSASRRATLARWKPAFRSRGQAPLERAVLAVEQLEDRAVASATLYDPPFAVVPLSMLVQSSSVEPSAERSDNFGRAVRRELIVIDSTVANPEALFADLLSSPETVGRTEYLVARLDGGGIASLTSLIASQNGLDAIHLISHGSAGELWLGGEAFNAGSLQASAPEIQEWGRSLTSDGDLLLYGCTVASGESGASFLEQLARVSGADVAASTDATGATRLGGDWDLEWSSGVIESRPMSDSQEGWGYVLGPSPTANDDIYLTPLNTALTVPARGVLLNDDERGGGVLTAVLEADAENGSVVLNADGSFTYTPDAGFTGTDIFRYRAVNSQGSSNNGHVFVTVGSSNAPPVAVPDAYVTDEGTPLTVLAANGLLNNDTDPNGNATFTLALASAPVHGNVTLQADGGFTYTPNADYTGTDSFTYQINDGSGGTATGTSTITVNPVNDPPVANDDQYTTSVNLIVLTLPLSISSPGVVANDVDADGDSLTAQLLTGVSHGFLSFNANGSFTYTAFLNFTGSDSFTYRVYDGTAWSAAATVTINVAFLNRAPTAGANSYSVQEDMPLVVGTPGLLVNDSDPDGDSLSAVLNSGPSKGVLDLNADGSFTYTPFANSSGSDSFTYHVTDGVLNSAAATVSITITPVNDLPTLNPIADRTVNEDSGPWTVPLTGISAGGGESQALRVTAQSSNASIVPTPVISYTSPNGTGNLTFTEVQDAAGTATITVTVRDAGFDGTFNTSDDKVVSRSFNITVVQVNDPPTAGNDTFTAGANITLNVPGPGVLANDFNVEGFPTTAVIANTTANGTLVLLGNGSFTYTPDSGFTGTDSFTYWASDTVGAYSNLATATINVLPATDPIVAGVDGYSVNEDGTLTGTTVLVNDYDPDGEPITAVLETGPAHGNLTLNSDGTFLYTPDPEFFGTDSFTYRAMDTVFAVSTPATVTITVGSVNDLPAATDDSGTLDEDDSLTIDVLANDSDVDSDALTITAATQGARGIVTFTGTEITYTPNANAHGTDSFTYTVSDGHGGTATATVAITIDPVDDRPTANPESYATSEDTPLVVPIASGLLINDNDVDGDPLLAELVTGPAHGTLVLNLDGSFTYTPDVDFFGTDSFEYQACDGDLFTSPITVTITIAPVNDDPIATDDTATVTTGGSAVIAVLDNDSDPENNSLAILSVASSLNGTVATDGVSITFTPNAGFVGTEVFTYIVGDGQGGTATATMRVVVLPGAITAREDLFDIQEGEVLTVRGGVLGNDTSPNARPLTASLVVGASHGTVTMSSDGSFTYVPDDGFTGTDSFQYLATDGLATSAVVEVRIVVRSVIPQVEEPELPGGETPAGDPTSPSFGTPGTPGPASQPGGGVVISVILTPGTIADPLGTTSTPTTPIAPTYFASFGPGGFTTEPAPAGAAEAPPAEVKGGPGEGEATAKTAPPAETKPTPRGAPVTAAVAVVANGVAIVTSPAAISDNALLALDRLKDEIGHSPKVVAYTEAVVVTGVSLTAGYVLLNTRFVFWFLSALLSRSAVRRTFDPLDVIYAWDGKAPLTAEDEESLQSMVGVIP